MGLRASITCITTNITECISCIMMRQKPSEYIWSSRLFGSMQISLKANIFRKHLWFSWRAGPLFTIAIWHFWPLQHANVSTYLAILVVTKSASLMQIINLLIIDPKMIMDPVTRFWAGMCQERCGDQDWSVVVANKKFVYTLITST